MKKLEEYFKDEIEAGFDGKSYLIGWMQSYLESDIKPEDKVRECLEAIKAWEKAIERGRST